MLALSGLDEPLHPLQVGVELGEVDLLHRQLGPRALLHGLALVELRLVAARVDAPDVLPLLDRVPLADRQVEQVAGEVGGELHLRWRPAACRRPVTLRVMGPLRTAEVCTVTGGSFLGDERRGDDADDGEHEDGSDDALGPGHGQRFLSATARRPRRGSGRRGR